VVTVRSADRSDKWAASTTVGRVIFYVLYLAVGIWMMYRGRKGIKEERIRGNFFQVHEGRSAVILGWLSLVIGSLISLYAIRLMIDTA